MLTKLALRPVENIMRGNNVVSNLIPVLEKFSLTHIFSDFPFDREGN